MYDVRALRAKEKTRGVSQIAAPQRTPTRAPCKKTLFILSCIVAT